MNELIQINVSFEYNPKVYVYKRTSRWYWKFKLPSGKWFYGVAPGADEQSAKRNARKKESELAKGFFNQKEVDKMQKTSSNLITFEKGIFDFIEYLKLEDCSPNYYKSMRKQLNKTSAFLQKKYKVEFVHKLTEADAFDFRNELLKRVKREEVKKVTVFRELNDIKRFYKWLRKRKKILKNPWLEIEAISVPKEERARTVAPTLDVLTQLMKAPYLHRYGFPIKEFAYGLFRTGARKEELLYMEVDDVDWETGHWIIKVKDCPTKHGYRWSPKYGKKRETIIPSDVLDLLRPLVQRALTHKVVGYSPNDKGIQVPIDAAFIFTMKDRSKSKESEETVYRRVDEVRAAWGALFVSAGLVEAKEYTSDSTKKYKGGKKKRTDFKAPFTRHDFRRGFNIAAMESGMTLDERVLVLGHGRTVNEEHYCGKAKFDIKKFSKLLNKAK